MDCATRSVSGTVGKNACNSLEDSALSVTTPTL
nr:MAG TPA: hypothetical protein [Caudoviricetes sp.]